MIKKRIAALCLLLVMLVSLCTPVSAAGTESYTHWDISTYSKKSVYSKAVFEYETQITARSLGLESDITIMDIADDTDGNLYILLEDSQIIVADKDYKYKKTITLVDDDGYDMDFMDARGIYVTKDRIMVADSEYNRVLIADRSGKLVKELEQPDSSVLPEDFTFIPTRMIVDSKGFLYVISDGAYYGALLFSPEYEFLGFYGANMVSATVLSSLENLWDMLTKSDEKRGNSVRTLPFQFIDIALDDNDFIYTCTGTASGGSESGQVRMLSPGGSNILSKNYGSTVVDASSFNFSESDIAIRRGTSVRQSFIGVQADENGFIYALDSIYGLVYVYDRDCNLIATVGGGKDSGTRKGTFSGAASIEVHGGKIFVSDGFRNDITVFKKTEFGKRLMDAQILTLNGDYKNAEPFWNRILGEDQNCRLALSAISKSAYSQGDYTKAKKYAKEAVDRTIYDQAMKKEQEAFVSNNFVWIFLVIVALIVGIMWLLSISKKKKVVLVKNEKLRIMFGCAFHPFQNFNDIRYKEKGSVLIAAVLSLCFFVSAVINVVYTDFRFTTFDASTYNPIYQFVTTVGLIVLWTLSNWAISVLQEGKGKLKHVFIVTAYATLPLIIKNLIATVLSFWLNSTSGVVLSGINIVAMILTGIILVIGTMIIHEFSFPRFLFSALLTVFGMILIIFILFMIGMLLSQLWQFVGTVIMEVVYR